MASDHFVEGIWPRYRINLTTAHSGTGKTRWKAPQLIALKRGEPILGIATQPTRVAYVACDRTARDAKDTFISLGLDPEEIPIKSFMDNDMEWTAPNVLKLIPKDTELVFVEAIGALIPGGNMIDYHSVLRLGRDLNRMTRATGISWEGSTHCPKLKRNEEYLNLRDNVMGSAAWAGICGTIVLMLEKDGGQREVIILPRDGPPRTFMYEFDEQGRLVEVKDGIDRALMDFKLQVVPPGNIVTTSDIESWASEARISRATAHRWRDEQLEQSKLERIGKGQFRVCHKQ